MTHPLTPAYVADNRARMSDHEIAQRFTWQPIETAPKDGEFLVFDGTEIWLVQEGVFPKENGCGCCASAIYGITHWMPLPEPPK